MAEHKRIMISLPESMLEELDGFAALEQATRSEAVREAMRLYLEDRRRNELHSRLRDGYREMGALNAAIAEEALAAENESHLSPDWLAEAE